MKCIICGQGEMLRAPPQYVEYTWSGLSNVWIQAVVSTCTRCGETEVEIPAVEGLHKALAAALLKKSGPLVPHEIRFLRKSIGRSAVDFAALMGVSPATVSRWENGPQRMSAGHDRLVRLIVHTTHPIDDYSVDDLVQVDVIAPPALYRLRRNDGTWAMDRAA